tara:strand:- start:70 stop:243 length:174 start_codon:yes stop_codon:yes gene_type:complete
LANRGEIAIRIFRACSEIGQIKEPIKEAILDGKIPNEHQACFDFMIEKGQSLGLTLA